MAYLPDLKPAGRSTLSESLTLDVDRLVLRGVFSSLKPMEGSNYNCI